MMTRQKLREIKNELRARTNAHGHLDTQLLHSLVDSNLDALDKLESDQTVVELRKALTQSQQQSAERERQLALALDDLLKAVQDLATTASDSMHPEYGDKALYTLHQIKHMLAARGTKWSREWSYYQPRIEEEFTP